MALTLLWWIVSVGGIIYAINTWEWVQQRTPAPPLAVYPQTGREITQGYGMMALSFHNASRALDQSCGCVRFWAYDGALEISVFVEIDAIRKLAPQLKPIESEILGAFDDWRMRIEETAIKVYKRGRNQSFRCTITASDL
ncbi:MAG: DUF1488 family protein [Pseudomonadota bacterium]